MYRIILILLVIMIALSYPANAQDMFVTSGNSVKKITPAGIESLFADGGFNNPDGIVFDHHGNLFVANYTPSTVNKITPDGTVTVFASGFGGPYDIAIDNADNLYVPSAVANGNSTYIIYRVTPLGVVSNFAALPYFPLGLTFDATGNLFAACYGTKQIFKVTPLGTISVYVVTPDVEGVTPPVNNGLVFSSNGDLFVSGSHNIYKVTSTGNVSLFGSITHLAYLAFDNMGQLYASTTYATIVKIDTNGTITDFASNGVGYGHMAFQRNVVPSIKIQIQTPNIILGGNAGIGAIALSVVQTTDTLISVSSSDTSAATVPVTVTVPAGQTNATFPISTSPVDSEKTVIISATLNGVTQSALLTVDSPPLTIANAKVESYTASTAILYWETNRSATSQVKYRIQGTTQWQTTPEYGILVKLRRVGISWLKPVTPYDVEVVSKDNHGREVDSNIPTFTTAADIVAPDTTITIGPRAGGSAAPGPIVFQWTGTDDATRTEALLYQYRLDNGAWTPATASPSTTVTLNGLTLGNHTFSVRARDESGNTDPTPDARTFTINNTAPVVAGLGADSITYQSGRIFWTTSEPATTVIQWTSGTGDFTESIADGSLQLSHTLGIGPLLSNTDYRVRILSQDEAGNQSTSGEISLHTGKKRDLSISPSDITFSNPAPVAGDSLTMSAKVQNNADVLLSGVAVFFDGAGSEISRAAVSVPAHAASGQTVTSAPFTAVQGQTRPSVQIISVTPGDDVPGNNLAFTDLLVNAPAFKLSVTASTFRTWVGNDSLFSILVKNIGFMPQNISSASISGLAWVQPLDSLPAEPLNPGDEIQLTFRVIVPIDAIGGLADSPVVWPLTAAVNGTTQSFNLELFQDPISSLNVTIRDNSTGSPITGAIVGLDNTEKQWVTGVTGQPLNDTGAVTSLAVTSGSRTVFAYAPGYIPASISTTGTGSVTLSLNKGKPLEITEVKTTLLTTDEIIRRGVNLADPANYLVYDFAIAMEIGTVTVPNIIIPKVPTSGYTVTVPFTGGGGTAVSGTVQRVYENTTEYTETWIVIPGDIRILKQFWDATVFLRNNTSFNVNTTSATLKLPEGLSLPDLTIGGSYAPQSPMISLGAIAPMSQKQASWVVRGDRAGRYRLVGTAVGSLMLGRSPVNLNAALTSDILEVIQPKLHVTFVTPGAVFQNTGFTLGINVTNNTSISLNGVSVELKGPRLVNCKLADGETLSKYLNTLAVGETKSVTFNLVSLVNGVVKSVDSFVSPAPIDIPGVEVTPGQPYLSYTDPNFALPGSGDVALTAYGDTFDSSAVIQWEGTDLATTWVSPIRLTTSIPASLLVTPGSYTITVKSGTGVISNPRIFTVAPLPTLTSLSPAVVGANSGDFTLIVNGSGFFSDAAIQWNGANLPTYFDSSGKLEALITNDLITTPGTITITVGNPGSGGGTSNSLNLSVLAPSSITSLAPNGVLRGAAATTIVVTGSGFQTGTKVSFGGTILATTYVSAMKLKASIPKTSLQFAGLFPVQTVNIVNGNPIESAPVIFAVKFPIPLLKKIVPATAATSTAFTMSLSGTGFVPESQVLWNGVSRPVTYTNSTTLKVNVTGADTIGGNITIQVVNPTPGGGSSGILTLLVANPSMSVSYIITRTTTTQVKVTYTVTNTGTVRVTNVKQTLGSLVLSSPSLTVKSSPATQVVAAALEPGTSATKSVTFTNARLTAGTPANLTLTLGVDGGYTVTTGGAVTLP